MSFGVTFQSSCRYVPWSQAREICETAIPVLPDRHRRAQQHGSDGVAGVRSEVQRIRATGERVIKIEVCGVEAAAVLILSHRHVSKCKLVLPKNLDKVQRATGSGPGKCALSSSLLWPLTEVAGRHNQPGIQAKPDR